MVGQDDRAAVAQLAPAKCSEQAVRLGQVGEQAGALSVRISLERLGGFCGKVASIHSANSATPVWSGSAGRSPSPCRTCRFPLLFASLTGRSGHGFACRLSLSGTSVTACGLISAGQASAPDMGGLMATVTLDRLTKKYPNGFVAVTDLSIDIADGEFLVLVGPSGCGKSTALRMVAGLEEISDGELLIGSERMNEVEPKDRNIAMVFQSYALYPHLDVARNIGFPLKLAGVPKAEIIERVTEAARLLELEPLLGNKPAQLSGGQRQRVAMGRAIVRDPAVFLMDEPLSNLDAKLRVQMRAEITALQHRLGATTIYVTHDQVEAMTMGDRVAVLKDGLLQQVDDPTDLYERPDNLFVAGFIGAPAMNLRLARLSSGAGASGGDDGWRLQLGSQTLELSERVIESRPALRGYDGVDVVVGIRPEAFEDAAVANDGAAPRLRATVSLTEALGSDLLLHFPLDAPSVEAGDPDALEGIEDRMVIARVHPRSTARLGSTVELTVDVDELHFFDSETEAAIRG